MFGGSENLEGSKCLILGEQQYIIGDTASQSEKWLLFLKIWGAWPPKEWWSLETRLETHFARLGSVSKASGLVSVSKVSGFETLNIAKNWFNKISITEPFLVCCIFRWEATKTCRKNYRNLKKIRFRNNNDVFKINFGKIHKFWSLESLSRTSSLESRSWSFRWSLGLGSSGNFNQVSVSKITVSTA